MTSHIAQRSLSASGLGQYTRKLPVFLSNPTIRRFLSSTLLVTWRISFSTGRSTPWCEKEKQEVKDLWHIWSIYQLCYHMLSGGDPLSTLWLVLRDHVTFGRGSSREQIHSDFLNLWLTQRDHISGRGSAPDHVMPLSLSEPIHSRNLQISNFW